MNFTINVADDNKVTILIDGADRTAEVRGGIAWALHQVGDIFKFCRRALRVSK